MSDRLKKSPPQIWSDSRNVTSSPALAGGVTPSGLPAGQTLDPCGPAVVRASPLVNQIAGSTRTEPSPTNAISGRHGSGSLESMSLASSLASRLQVLTASSGSTLYQLTWKCRDTPSRRRIFALRASALRTSDSESTGWPSPAVSDARGSDYSSWATPTVRDHKDGASKGTAPINALLGRQAWTVTGVTWRGRRVLIHRVPDAGVRLNPAHSRWLMGYPPAWDVCAVTAMPSSRSSRRRS